jgi:hypothetical protein
MVDEMTGMDMSEFDSEPGRTISSDKPQQDTGASYVPAPEVPEEPQPITPDQPEQVAEGEEPSGDYDNLQAQLEELERQNENLRSATGRLGTELEQKNAQIRMFQQAPQPQPVAGVSESDYLDDPKAYIDQKFSQKQQQQFLLDNARSDMEFKARNSVTQDVEQAVQTYQMLNGLASFKDASHSMANQGILRLPKKETTPQRKVAVQPKAGPVQTGGTPKAGGPPSGETMPNIDYDKWVESTSESERMEELKKTFGE